MRPKVSVIIPNFNYAHFLSEAIESVLQQSFQDFEVIVVDNFSTDSSESVVASFNDKRIRFVPYANSGSIARARNRGIELAQGDFIAFLDSDDKWDQTKLEFQLKWTHENSVSYHPLRFFGTKNWGKTSSWQVARPALESLISGGNPVATSSVMLDRKLLNSIGTFPEDQTLFAVEDFCLWLTLAAKGVHFVLIPKVLGGYRIHGSSSSRVDSSVGLQDFVTSNFGFIDPKAKMRFVGFLGYMRGLHLLRIGKFRDARNSLKEALLKATWRFRWRAGVRFAMSFVPTARKA